MTLHIPTPTSANTTMTPEPTNMTPVTTCENPQRRQWLMATVGLGGVFSLTAITPFVLSMLPSQRALAAGAPVEVDISKLALGEMMVAEWRGKPVWILRRTPEMLASLKVATPMLVDPDSKVASQQPDYAANETRSRQPEILVAIGICTHLGCSPSKAFTAGDPALGSDWPGGFLCPCHGSTFDFAGRVFKNKPAPTNLEIPPHHYVGDTRLIIGSDDEHTT